MKKMLNSLNDRFFQMVHGNRLTYNACWEDPAEEWNLILQNSSSGTKVLFRSAGIDHNFLPQTAKAALRFAHRQTETLHLQDRVGHIRQPAFR